MLRGSRRIVAQVPLSVGPALRPARSQENDRAGRDWAMTLLPFPHVGGAQPVIGIGLGLSGDIDDDPRRDQLGQGNLVGGPPVSSEMRGGVQVRAAVLRRTEGVHPVI